jgi:Bacterial Ig-like domain (group 1)
MHFRIRRLASVLLNCWLLLILTAPAVAQQPPGTLLGEDMVLDPNMNGNAQVFCNGRQSYFDIRGVATGPYPGNFEETGTFSFGNFFSADFYINTNFGTVTGHKDSYAAGEQVCNSLQFGYQVISNWYTNFSAVIPTPNGPCTVSGTAQVRADYVTDTRGNVIQAPFFDEVMTSSTACAAKPGPPAVVSLSPAEATNPVGTSHTITATVVDANGNPVPKQNVDFTVTGADSVSGSCITDPSGRCSFTYPGPQLPGADVITGCAGNAPNSPPCGEANKQWLLPASTPGQVTGGGQIQMPPTDKVSFGFNAQSDGTTTKGNCNVIDHDKRIHIKCENVQALVVAGTHATFFGQADQDGVTTNYRIDVDDLADPGAGMDTFKIQTDQGYIAGGFLTAGNITIHK